ncbi:MAG TPA: RING finger domain-containing protein [Candidatus Babeliales bacterium]|nr:RING finger domain-containing protein [Candidatus Babeliales bacterium]
MKKQLLFISLIMVSGSLFAAERAKGAGAGKLTKAVAGLAKVSAAKAKPVKEDISQVVVAMCPGCDKGISVEQTATAQTLPCQHMYHFNCAETAKALNGCFACEDTKKDRRDEVKAAPAVPAKKVVAPKQAAKREAPKKEIAKQKAAPKKEAEKQSCPICLEDKLTNPKALTCGHVFCTKCIDEALSKVSDRQGNLKIECPVCKKPAYAGAKPVRVAEGAGEATEEDMAAIIQALQQQGGIVAFGGGAEYVQRTCTLCAGAIARGQEQQRAGQWYHADCLALLS